MLLSKLCEAMKSSSYSPCWIDVEMRPEKGFSQERHLINDGKEPVAVPVLTWSSLSGAIPLSDMGDKGFCEKSSCLRAIDLAWE